MPASPGGLSQLCQRRPPRQGRASLRPPASSDACGLFPGPPAAAASAQGWGAAAGRAPAGAGPREHSLRVGSGEGGPDPWPMSWARRCRVRRHLCPGPALPGRQQVDGQAGPRPGAHLSPGGERGMRRRAVFGSGREGFGRAARPPRGAAAAPGWTGRFQGRRHPETAATGGRRGAGRGFWAGKRTPGSARGVAGRVSSGRPPALPSSVSSRPRGRSVAVPRLSASGTGSFLFPEQREPLGR